VSSFWRFSISKRSYRLVSGGQAHHIELICSLFWRNITIQLDGQPLGTITGGLKSYREGAEFVLADGSSLNIQAIWTLEGVDFFVLHDGIPLEGSATPPDPGKNIHASPTVIQYVLIVLFAGLIPGALLLWLGIWVEVASTGISDNVRCLLALGVFLAYLIFLPLYAAWRSDRPKTIRQWITAVQKVISWTFRNDKPE
jgi:hypothetical protein